MLRALIVLASVALAGCLDAATVAPTGTVDELPPVLPDVITALEPVTEVETPAGGNGIRVDEARALLFRTLGGGGLVVFDVTDPAEASPRTLSYVQAPAPGAVVNCGSHFGSFVADRPAVVWGWYQGGTVLIGLDDPANPVILDQESAGGSTWESVYYAGHVYGSAGAVEVFALA